MRISLPARIQLLFLALLLAGSGPGVAAAPVWAKDLTRAPIGPYRAVPPCELTFDLGWNRLISAGRISLTIKEAGPYWRAEAAGGSTGLARKLWRYDLRMTSYVERAGIRSRHTRHMETDSEETCRYRVAFEPHRIVTETTVAPHKGTTTIGTTTLSYGPVEDLLAIILYVRSLELTQGRKITRVVQPWDRPYLTTYTVLGRETLSFDGRKISCIKLGVEVRKIDRNSLAVITYGKVKKATIWLSDDELRLPIEMRADIFVGYVSARMVKVKLLSGREARAPAPSAASMIVEPLKR